MGRRKTNISDLPLDALGQVLGPNIRTMKDMGALANVSKSFRSGVAHLMGPDSRAPKPSSVLNATVHRQIDKKAVNANPFRDWLYGPCIFNTADMQEARKRNDGLERLERADPEFRMNEGRRVKKQADRLMKAVGSKTRFSAPPSEKSLKQIKGVKTRLINLRNKRK